MTGIDSGFLGLENLRYLLQNGKGGLCGAMGIVGIFTVVGVLGLCVCKTHQTVFLNWEHFVCKLCLTEFRYS